MRTAGRWPAVALLLLLGLGQPRPAPAQGAPAAPVAPLERATVELVLIEAYATDRDDRPVRGLRPEDFVLLVDGRVQPIASLEHRVVAGAPAGPGETGAAETAGPRHPRRFVLFFDDETSAPQSLATARTAAERVLADGLLPGDQVALVSYRRRLVLLHDFTTDREALRRTLRDSLEDRARISMFDIESRERTEELRRALRSAGATQGAFALNAIVREEIQHYRGVLQALTGLVDTLAAWPGYRAIVVWSDGIAEYPGTLHVDRLNLIPRPVALEQAVQEQHLSQELEAIGRSAAGAGVTLHTVQTSGLAAGHAGEQRAASRRSNALESLALNTGGVTSSSNDLTRGLTEADRASREYYLVAYAPEGPPDGLHHTVRLRVRKSGVRLRYRTGFTRFPPDDQRRRAIQAAHLLPDLHRDLDVSLAAVPGPLERGERITDLVLHVPPGQILLLPQAGRAVATVEAGFVAIDGEARETLRLARRFRIETDPARAQGDDLGFNLVARVHLPPATRTVTAVLSDASRDALGAARLALPAAPEPGAVHGLSLYSLSEESLWVEMPAEGPAAETAAAFTVGPALKTVFAPGEPVACGFRVPPAAAPRQVTVSILAGERSVRTLEVGPEEDRRGPVKLPLPTEGLPPGDYVLVVVERREGPPVECGKVAFRIVAYAAGPAGGGR
jgi:VWFA-related protein